jgi:hypothetical protein
MIGMARYVVLPSYVVLIKLGLHIVFVVIADSRDMRY